MKINFQQAQKLNGALAPNPFSSAQMQWLPLTEVKNLGDEHKFNAAIKLLETWKEANQKERKQQVEKYKASSNTSKIFEIIMGILVAICFITSFMNPPPASYAIELYCDIFETANYSPMLIGLILTLVLLVPWFLVKKAINKGNE